MQLKSNTSWACKHPSGLLTNVQDGSCGWQSAVSSGGLPSRVTTRGLSMRLGLLKELGAEKKPLKSRCSRRPQQKLQDFRSPRTSLPLCSVGQAVTGPAWTQGQGNETPSLMRGTACVYRREGMDGVTVEITNHMYFMCIM